MNQLYALLLTLACEIPAIFLFARSFPVMRILLVSVGASCITHPIAWHFSSVLAPTEYVEGVWLIEIGVILVEGIWYQFWFRPGFGKSFSWSAFANASSFGIGWLLLSS